MFVLHKLIINLQECGEHDAFGVSKIMLKVGKQ